MEDSSSAPMRREFIGMMATGMVAVAAPAVAQQQGNSEAQAAPLIKPQSPTKEYPQPPFPRQPQPWSGLGIKMTPVPDHGERSYRGTGKLIGRKALITGGDSGIGRAAAIAYAREGGGRRYQLSARRGAGRSAGGRADPRSGRKAVPISGDIRDEGFCQKLVARAARELGGLDILVNNAGRQHSVDNITDLSSDQFDWTLKTNLYYGSGQVFGSSGGTGED